jgi:hypothetical protein
VPSAEDAAAIAASTVFEPDLPSPEPTEQEPEVVAETAIDEPASAAPSKGEA